MPLEKGTTQGGVLSPCLFILSMVHLVETYPEGSKVDKYVDDIKHFTRASKSSMLLKALSSLGILIENTDFLGMCFSAPKCNAMSFGMSRPDTQLHIKIKGVTVHLIDYQLVLGLGMYIDRGLTFNKQ